MIISFEFDFIKVRVQPYIRKVRRNIVTRKYAYYIHMKIFGPNRKEGRKGGAAGKNYMDLIEHFIIYALQQILLR
jgi:hypothetical protein